MVWSGLKPIPGFPATTLSESDGFDGSNLKPWWEWRYQPDPNAWSLAERPGYLRLHASSALRPDDFNAIPNVLTQRSLRTRRSQVTVRIDLSGMVDGQESGLAHFARTYATLSVVQADGVRHLSYNSNGARRTGPPIQGKIIYLRSIWGADGESQFSYSADGRTYRLFGDPYTLTWAGYRGDRVGLFSVSAAQRAGYVDIDWFRYEVRR
jgi:beta-xylosidase